MLSGEESTPRDTFYYYRGSKLCAIRRGAYKLHILAPNDDKTGELLPYLYNIEQDVAEMYNIAKQNPDKVEELMIRIRLRNEVKKPPIHL
ncbi:MAG: hypothetical protein SNF92_09180 [Rikenellaceae bacterium]